MSEVVPTINNSTFDSYGASILAYSIGPCDYTDGFLLPKGSMIPVKLNYSLGLRPITLTLDFEGNTEADIADNIMSFTYALHEGAEIVLPDGYIYSCFYKSATAPLEKAPWIKQVKFTLTGYRHGEQETFSFSVTGPQSRILTVKGNYKTPAVITVITDADEITVAGVTVSNISGTIVIDGMKKTITENGYNKFADSDLTEFPYFVPGSNTFVVNMTSGSTASIQASYYPIYR